MNILITNIGRRGYLTTYIKEIDDFSGKVYVSDCDQMSSGLYGDNDGHYILPKPVDDEEKYVEDLLALCNKLMITLVIPVIDPEIYILSRYREVFKEQGITVMVSDERVLDICHNKVNMNSFLKNHNILHPKTYIKLSEVKQDISNKTIDFPLIVKPIKGSGSVKTNIAYSEDELAVYFSDGMMIQEAINGQEYGIDVLNDLGGKPISCVIKKKISMRSGETDKALTVKDKKIKELAIRLATNLKHIGNLDFDILVNENGIYVIDLNPRFGGGYPATHEAGGQHLRKIIQMVSGETISESFDQYEENLLVMKTIGTVSVKVGAE